jgi:hypothetical protein
MSRDVVKVYCHRNHRVGTVIADAAGLRIEYTAAVLHTEGTIFGSSRLCVMRLGDDDVTGFNAYCKSCKSPVALSVRGLRAAALDGVREIQAPSATAIVKWLRHDPRHAGE